MIYEEGGRRIKDLHKLLNAVAEIYTLARGRGILSVKFINHPKGKRNVRPEGVDDVISKFNPGGMTKIGTELESKILNIFTGSGRRMKKPLLVMVIIDGRVWSPTNFRPPFPLPRGHELSLSQPEGEYTKRLGSVISQAIADLPGGPDCL